MNFKYMPTFHNISQVKFNGNNVDTPSLNNFKFNNRIQSNSTNSSLQRLNSDTVEISKNNSNEVKKNTTKRNAIIGIGATAVAIGIGLLSCHTIPTKVANKTFDPVDIQFAKLEQNIKEVQSKFQKIFRRKDLSIKETKEMLNQYKKLERMRLDDNVSIEDYMKEVFNTAIKNYDLENANIKLDLQPVNNSVSGGCWQSYINTIKFYTNITKEEAFGPIHHELRHAKQDQEIAECLSEKDLEKVLKTSALNQYNNIILSRQIIDTKTMEEFENDIWSDIDETVMNSALQLRRKGVVKTADDISYAKKCIDGECSYTRAEHDMSKYWNNFTEIDARFVDITMNEMFGLNKSQIDFYKEMDAKYLKQ